MARTEPSAASSAPDMLDHLSPGDALSVLRILARDEALAPRIRQVVAAHLEQNAPRDEEDVADIADGIRWELEQLEVEEVWDGAGRTRHGYVETGEVADEMIGRVLEPYLDDLERYQRLGMEHAATHLCMGLLAGLYQFEHESETQFKEWATDLPAGHAELALAKWLDLRPSAKQVKAMRAFVQQSLDRWDGFLLRALSSKTVVRGD